MEKCVNWKNQPLGQLVDEMQSVRLCHTNMHVIGLVQQINRKLPILWCFVLPL